MCMTWLPQFRPLRVPILALSLLIGLAACERIGKPPPKLPPKPTLESSIAGTSEIVVITRKSATTYFEDEAGNSSGLEYDLVKLFAEDLKLPVRFIVASELEQISQALTGQLVHFAAAGIGQSKQWADKVAFGEPYQTVRFQVVYNRDDRKPKTLADLVGKKIEVVAGSNNVEALTTAQYDFPALTWSEVRIEDSAKLLEKVANGTIDYVVAASHVVDVAKNFHPDLRTAFSIGEPQSLAWAFPPAHSEWKARSDEFFARIKKDGTLRRLLDRYYGHIGRFDQLYLAHFREKVRTALPAFREYFYEAEWATGIDWRLLAALAFQESHWDPQATSSTGVRGLMMLTEDTAERMKVGNRLDPKQSIMGGSRYLQTLRKTLPERIPEPDRTWIALAAYNLGLGHLEDGRVLTQKRDLNPDSWIDIKKTLPLLAQEEHYSKLKYGAARGGEAAVMTENVRLYYDIIRDLEAPLPAREESSASADLPSAR